MKVSRQSPCKINLQLNVLRKREDGFHELATLMHPIALCDDLEFTECSDGIQIHCNHPELNSDETNLIHRAAKSFLETARITAGVLIRHEKRVPLGGGLGGGSANAAHTLLGLNELFGDPLSLAQLHEIAACHGSDINFFLQDGPALATGRGENIAPCGPLPALAGKGLLLINPGFGIPTPWTFSRLANYPAAITGDATRGPALVEHLQQADLQPAPRLLFNSLEGPVLPKYPILAAYQDFLQANGALLVMMSGSGSSTYAITESPAAADDLRERFILHFGTDCWVRSLPLSPP